MTNLERALLVTPGASQTRSKAPGQMGPRQASPDGEYPLFAVKAWDCFVQDDKGRTYVDCFGANAAVPLGHANALVTAALSDALSGGSLLPLPSVREAAVSEQFIETCAPWAQQVRWLRTGSEAVSAAVRLARIATGRAKVVMFESSYHGWHDTSYARFRQPHPVAAWHSDGNSVGENGVPCAQWPAVELLPYGDFEALDRIGPDVAAVLVEAERFRQTDPVWLRAVRKGAHRQGALLVLDEMVYGMRWAHGGAAEFYKVVPDLACFGKAIGNGVPVSCVVGPANLMAPAAQYVSGTYGGDTLGLAAVAAVLHAYKSTRALERLWSSGLALQAAYRAAGGPADVMQGFPVHWRLNLEPDVMDRALEHMASSRILVHRGSNNASAAMVEAVAEMAGREIAAAVLKSLEESK